MARKEFTYKGKSLEQLKTMDAKEFAEISTSRIRRCITRGFNDTQKALLKKLKAGKDNVETHSRDMVILPEMLGKKIKVHRGNSFEIVDIQPFMLGHCLGEFVLTRKRLAHSAPGVGATKSSANLSVK